MTDVDVVVDPADFAGIYGSGGGRQGDQTRTSGDAWLRRRTPGECQAPHHLPDSRPLSPIWVSGTDRVEELCWAVNELVTDADGRQWWPATPANAELPAQLVIRAVGYPRRCAAGPAFDDRAGTIPHTDGGSRQPQMSMSSAGSSAGRPVIGSNKKDSADTVDALATDLAAADPALPAPDRGDDLPVVAVARQRNW